ncbi:MAG: tetratricopeptide repeat protein [Bacteroidota bacterium]
MRTSLFIFLGLLLGFAPAGNASTVDSLRQEINWQAPDTNDVHNLIKIAAQFADQYESDSVVKYGHLTVMHSRDLAFLHGQASGNRSLAISYWNDGELDSALKYCERSRMDFLADGDSSRFQNQSFLRGMILGDYGRYEEALASHYQVLAYFRRLKPKRITNVLNSIGILQMYRGNMVESEEAYLEAIQSAQQNLNLEMEANATSNLGDLYRHLGRLDEALALFKKVLKMDQEMNMEWGIGFQYVNIGNVYHDQKKYAEAIEYQLKGLEIRRKFGQKLHLGSNLYVLGQSYFDWGKPKQALPYLLEALEIQQEIKAAEYEKTTTRTLAECYAALEQYEKAYGLMDAAHILNDTLYTKEKTEAVEELTTRYESEKKEAEIQLLTATTNLQEAALQNEAIIRYALLAGLGLLLVIALLVWRSQQRKLQNERLLNHKQQELQDSIYQQNLTELELKALRAQMNPHFIFNCMNSINRLILAGENQQAARNLTKFSKLVRMILAFSERKSISLQEELELLETYIQLEAQRFKGKIQYEIRVDESLDTEEVEVPSMVLQPFIENAIWHGLMHKEEGEGKLQIKIEEKGELLHCSIEDNGVGRDKALALKNKAAVSHQSMALRLTRERLSLLHKGNLDRLIQIFDLKDAAQQAIGTRVELSIPI